jgi:hypothetical protein
MPTESTAEGQTAVPTGFDTTGAAVHAPPPPSVEPDADELRSKAPARKAEADHEKRIQDLLKGKYSPGSTDERPPSTTDDDDQDDGRKLTAKERRDQAIERKRDQKEAAKLKKQLETIQKERDEAKGEVDRFSKMSDLDKVGGGKGLQKLIDGINKGDVEIKDEHKILSKEQQEIADLKKQIADLSEPLKKLQEERDQHEQKAAIEEDNKILKGHIDDWSDDFPSLQASGEWGLNQLREKVWRIVDEQGSITEDDIREAAQEIEDIVTRDVKPILSSDKALLKFLSGLTDEQKAKALQALGGTQANQRANRLPTKSETRGATEVTGKDRATKTDRVVSTKTTLEDQVEAWEARLQDAMPR